MKKEDTHYRLLPMAGAYNMRDLGVIAPFMANM